MRHAQRASFYKKMSFKEKVSQLLHQALEENKELFLIDFTISESNKIEVILDGDNGVVLQDCINISRAIRHKIQASEKEHDFSLEVASAGVSSPLKLIRQYKKNIGRTIKSKNHKRNRN